MEGGHHLYEALGAVFRSRHFLRVAGSVRTVIEIGQQAADTGLIVFENLAVDVFLDKRL